MIVKLDIGIEKYALVDMPFVDGGQRYGAGEITFQVDGDSVEPIMIETFDGAVLWDNQVGEYCEQVIPRELWNEVERIKQQYFYDLKSEPEPDGFANDSDYWKWKEG